MMNRRGFLLTSLPGAVGGRARRIGGEVPEDGRLRQSRIGIVEATPPAVMRALGW